MSFSFDILRRITTFSERHSELYVVSEKRRHLWNLVFRRYFWRRVWAVPAHGEDRIFQHRWKQNKFCLIGKE